VIHQTQEKYIRMTPVIEGFSASVCLDIFYTHQWNGGVKILIAFCCVWNAPQIGF